MAKTYYQEGKVLDWTNSSGSLVVSGEMLRFGSQLGIAVDDIPDGEVGAVYVEDVWILPKTSADTVAVGDMLNFNATAGELTTGAAGAGGLTDAAMAVQAAAGGETTVIVKLGNFGTPT